MKKPYLHMFPTFRNRQTRERAIVYHVFGTMRTHGVDIYAYRSRYGQGGPIFTSKQDAIEWLKSMGFA